MSATDPRRGAGRPDEAAHHQGRDRDDALLGQLVACLPDVGVHPEHLVQNDDGGSRHDLLPRDISAELTVPTFYGDAILHMRSPEVDISIENLRRLNRIGGVPSVWECLRANGY